MAAAESFADYLVSHEVPSALSSALSQLPGLHGNGEPSPIETLADCLRCLRVPAPLSRVLASRLTRATFLRVTLETLLPLTGSLSALEFHAVVQLLCPDLPLEMVVRGVRVVLGSVPVSPCLRVSEFIYGFQLVVSYGDLVTALEDAFTVLLMNQGHPKGSTDQGSTDKGSADKGSTDKGSTDKGSTDKGSADKGSTDQGSTDKGSTDKGSADKGSTDKGSTDKGSTDKGSTDKGGTDKGSADKGSTDKGIADKGSTDKGSTDEGSGEEGSGEEGSGEEGSSEEGSSEEGSSGEGSSGEGSSGEGSSCPADQVNVRELLRFMRKSGFSSEFSLSLLETETLGRVSVSLSQLLLLLSQSQDLNTEIGALPAREELLSQLGY